MRQTEALVRTAKGKADNNGQGGRDGTAKAGKTPAIRDLEARLARKLGTKCEVRDKNGKGEIAVAYATLDELDRLLETLL